MDKQSDKKTEDITCIKTEILEKAPLVKTEKTQRPTPNYISKKVHEYVHRSIKEYQVMGNGNTQFLCCRFNHDDEYIAAGGADGFVHIFSVDLAFKELVLSENIGTSVTALRWSPRKDRRNLLISCSADGHIAHYKAGKVLAKTRELENQILCMDITSDGTEFATAGKDRTIRIYDEEKQKIKQELLPALLNEVGHANRIFAVKFDPENSNLLLSGGWDNNLIFWDVRDKKAMEAIGGTSISGDTIDIKNGKILVGSYRNEDQLELYDLGKRKKIRDIFWEDDHNPKNVLVYGCQFSKNNNNTILAGCCGLDEVRVFDPNNDYKCFGSSGEFHHKVFSVDFAHNHEMFAYCGSDGHVHTVKMYEELIKADGKKENKGDEAD